MNRELRQAWVDALRSGEYEQTQRDLRRLEPRTETLPEGTVELPAGYCCLGVLADACVNLWPDRFAWIEGDTVVQFPAMRFHEYDDGWDLVEGLNETSGELEQMAALLGLGHVHEGELIGLNDTQRKDFGFIANWIEENVPVDDTPLAFLVVE